ncbi:hypothetical protein [Arcobacter sp. FWKO B]|uniref:hypothetical protein n=1 Tax=Arcobacter sp. FWKO B TaxID=2593672 RepID=UPI0018A52DA0|nr:hypothetical protein [Arcobacter sp. FWKO B]QOG12537.1 hypothetical protein FWKOB_07395 [Arcobacter sp. FWKO B]
MQDNIASNLNYKKGAIDQIMLWLLLFALFVSFLFFVIDYSSAIRVKDNCDSIADYGARMKGLGNEESTIASGINQIKIDYFPTISGGDIVCTEDSSTENYQVIFNVYATYNSKFLPSSNIHAKKVVFNEVNKSQITCNLTLN